MPPPPVKKLRISDPELLLCLRLFFKESADQVPDRVSQVKAGGCGISAAHDIQQIGYCIAVFALQHLQGDLLHVGGCAAVGFDQFFLGRGHFHGNIR